MFIYVDLETKESFTASDLKAISKATGRNYHSLVYRLRNKDFYQHNYKFIVSRLSGHWKSSRNPYKYRKD